MSLQRHNVKKLYRPLWGGIFFECNTKAKNNHHNPEKSTLPHIFPFHNKEVKYYERRNANESINFGRDKSATQHSHPGPAISCFGCKKNKNFLQISLYFLNILSI